MRFQLLLVSSSIHFQYSKGVEKRTNSTLPVLSAWLHSQALEFDNNNKILYKLLLCIFFEGHFLSQRVSMNEQVHFLKQQCRDTQAHGGKGAGW